MGLAFDHARTARRVFAAGVVLLALAVTLTMPATARAQAVRCGQVLTHSTTVGNDLSECPGDGLVIGAPGITVDLAGHTVDGVGLGVGVRNGGHRSVTVRNGSVRDFDWGVALGPGTESNAVEALALELNQIGGIGLLAAGVPGRGNRIRANTLHTNAYGIWLVASSGNHLLGNTIDVSGKEGLLVEHSSHNRFERNRYLGGSDSGFTFRGAHSNYLAANSVAGASDRAFLLEGSNRNTLVDNSVGTSGDSGLLLDGSSFNALVANHVEASGDAPFALIQGSHANRLQSNSSDGGGDAGFLAQDSHWNRLTGNVAHHSSDEGVDLNRAHGTAVQGNDLRFNTGGVSLVDSGSNRLEANNVSDTGGTGIQIDGESVANPVVRNTARRVGGGGIYIGADTIAPDGSLVRGNVLDGNVAGDSLGEGIHVAKGGHTLRNNIADHNQGWGMYAALGTIDGGGNFAWANAEAAQCWNLVCHSPPGGDRTAPQTTIVGGPPSRTRTRSALFAFSSSERGSRFECSLDGGAFAACDTPTGYSTLPAGGHWFAVRAVDVFGNRDGSPATMSWTIDGQAPPTSGPGSGGWPPSSRPGTPVRGSTPASGSTPPGVRRAARRVDPCRRLRGRRHRICRLNQRIARRCGRLQGRRKRICAKRVRAVARCKNIRVRSRRSHRRKVRCLRRARAIGRGR